MNDSTNARLSRLHRERDAMTALWSSLGHLKHIDFNDATADELTATFGLGRQRHQHILDSVWSFQHLTTDAQDRIDTAIAIDYPELFEARGDE